jgi:hypothetical protein
MRGKMWFLGGLAVGYVVGTRAGRERYDQLMQSARQLRENPTVQEAAGVVQEQANRLFAGGKQAMNEKLSQSRFGERKARREAAQAEEMGAPANAEDTLAGTTRRSTGTSM